MKWVELRNVIGSTSVLILGPDLKESPELFLKIWKESHNQDVTREQVKAVKIQISGRLRRLRELQRIDQASIAADMKMHRSKYGAVERGQTNYGIDALIVVLDYWKINPLALFSAKARMKTRVNPEAELAIEQLRDVIQAGGERASNALYSIRSWHATLPKPKP